MHDNFIMSFSLYVFDVNLECIRLGISFSINPSVAFVS